MSVNIKMPTNKNFGLVFFVVFFLIFIEPIIRNDELRYWSLIVSIIFLILGLINSKILSPLNKIWFQFGLLIGKLVSPIIMGLVFFLVVTPTSLLLRLFGKDILKIKKKKKSEKSYWLEKSGKTTTMKNQF
jgi:predicted membrane metal-binding protein